jgi:hypothetical protein
MGDKKQAEPDPAAVAKAAAERAAAEKAEADKKVSDLAFDSAVRAIITTFGVFTGIAIKAAFDVTRIKLPDVSQSWFAFLNLFCDVNLFTSIAVIALLLRYILGSAVHLNVVYALDPRDKNFVMLFKDLGFLVVFGLFAVLMIEAKGVAEFGMRASWFVAVGTAWSLLDLAIRGFRPAAVKTSFSIRWMVIDGLQLALILVVLYLVTHDLLQSILLAVGFSLALLGDMWVILPRARAAAA